MQKYPRPPGAAVITGVVLAAGLSKRMGAPKQSLLIAGRPMLDYVVDAFLASNLDRVVLVLRKGLSSPRARRRLRVVINPHPEYGISESLRVGMRALDKGTKAVVVGLGDKPVLQAPTINSLISSFSAAKSQLVVPVFRGTRGNPVVFGSSLFHEMMELKGDYGAKVLLEKYAGDVLELPVGDEGVLLDVNTRDDVRRIEEVLRRKRLARE